MEWNTFHKAMQARQEMKKMTVKQVESKGSEPSISPSTSAPIPMTESAGVADRKNEHHLEITSATSIIINVPCVPAAGDLDSRTSSRASRRYRRNPVSARFLEILRENQENQKNALATEAHTQIKEEGFTEENEPPKEQSEPSMKQNDLIVIQGDSLLNGVINEPDFKKPGFNASTESTLVKEVEELRIEVSSESECISRGASEVANDSCECSTSSFISQREKSCPLSTKSYDTSTSEEIGESSHDDCCSYSASTMESYEERYKDFRNCSSIIQSIRGSDLRKRNVHKKAQPNPSICRKIANFAYKKNIHQSTIERALETRIGVYQAHLPMEGISNYSNPVMVNFSTFPPTIRPPPTSLLRPVVIDACGLLHFYNGDILDMWLQGNTDSHAWDERRILPMKPIVEVAIECLSMGHKVYTVLPCYYRTPTVANRSKVDNLAAYKVLKELELLIFMDPSEDNIRDLFQVVQEFVSEKGACFISSMEIQRAYRAIRGERKMDCGYKANKPNKLDMEYFKQLSENSESRILHVDFVGPARTLIFSPYLTVWCGTNRKDHVRRKNTYKLFDEEIMFYYSPAEKKVKEDIQLTEQLTFGNQCRLLISLSEVIDLNPQHVAAMQMIFRLAATSIEITTRLSFQLEKYARRHSSDRPHE